MTLFDTIKLIKEIACSQPSVHSVGDGDIYDFLNADPANKYATFFISQTTHTEDEDFWTFGFNLFYVDRLDDSMENNRLLIQNDALIVLSNVLRTLKTEDIDVETVTYQPFQQKFTDQCAGAYATVTLTVPKNYICEEEYD